MPNMIPVESSNIKAIGFEPAPHEEDEDPAYGVLYIEFKTGRTYEYEDVEFDVWCEFHQVATSGGSLGQFFAQRIQHAGYIYRWS